MDESRASVADRPDTECDVIMKGGITSGVVYPRALTRLAASYRLRRLGGASAGAIGAAFGAAAEHGRGRPGAGFEALAAVPGELGDGRLARLFQPRPETRPLLGLMLAATGHDAPGASSTGPARLGKVVASLVRGWPLAAVLGLLPGLLALVAVLTGPLTWRSWLAALLALVVMLIGLAIAVAWAVYRTATRSVPANQFGICTGLGDAGDGPGFTDWLSQRLNTLAGRAPDDPLRYGHLWTGSDEIATRGPDDREVDLRMMSTCLTQGRPYEMPWASRAFFYEPAVWSTLFPPEVMTALASAPPARPDDDASVADWEWEEEVASRLARPLRRLPDPAHLPVIVGVRLSLSFPLLISAVPLWSIDRRSRQTRDAVAARRAGRAGPDPAFVEHWFTDGGFTSNFPVHLFDDALPVRPAFAINLGSFLPGREPSTDESANLEYAQSNAALLPSHRPLPAAGFGALAGFLSAALATSREWADASQLTTPGLRERVVRVLQSRSEGGLNLFMDTPTIDRLATRGGAAADALVGTFEGPWGAGPHTGWDNHRWVRYRALLASLPAWLRQYAAGRRAQAGLDPAAPPSYAMTVAERELARRLDEALATASAAVEEPGNADAARRLAATPRPVTVLRRVPQV